MDLDYRQVMNSLPHGNDHAFDEGLNREPVHTGTSIISPEEDGGYNIELDPSIDFGESEPETHLDNLAAKLGKSQLSAIGLHLKSAIEEDDESRSQWRGLVKNGLEQLGLTVDTPTWPFKNASGVYSSAFIQALINLVSTAIAELFPPKGPVKIEILGESDDALDERGRRVEAWMNHYLTDVCQDYYPDWEQALMWCVLQGSVFKKTYLDPVLNRPVSPFIEPKDIIINSGAKSIASAARITHALNLSARDIFLRRKSGMYLDTEIMPSEVPLDEEITITVNEIQGMSPSSSEYNKVYRLYECHVDLDLLSFESETRGVDRELSNMPLPYIITINAETGDVLSIYRNWEEGDETFARQSFFTHAYFHPGFGLYGMGLSHIAGSSAKAATTSMRQNMDAATLANFPGGLMTKGLAGNSSNIRMGPTEFHQMETGGRPISEVLMMMPYNPPSDISYQMKKDLEGDILQIAGALSMETTSFNQNAPVGTTLALLEQSHKVQNGFVKRLHRALKQELGLVYKIFSTSLPESPYPFKVPGGSHSIMKTDFTDDLGVCPVSDPNLSSSTERMIRNEALIRFAQASPEIHDMHEVYKRMYLSLDVSNVEALLPPPPPPDPNAPPPLMDPSIPMMKDVEAKLESAKLKAQIEGERIKLEAHKVDLMFKQLEFEKIKFEQELTIEKMKLEQKQQSDSVKNEIASLKVKFDAMSKMAGKNEEPEQIPNQQPYLE